MYILSLYYNDSHIANRNLIHLDLNGFIIETNDLGLNIHSLVSINISRDGLPGGSSFRIPAVVSELGEHTLQAKFESLGELELKIIEQYMANNHNQAPSHLPFS